MKRCLAYLPKSTHPKEGGRCILEKGHEERHRTAGKSEWTSFHDEVASWLHPNTDGKEKKE